jgi:uncharacterized membrane protein YoaK (UPF0700 family)
MATLAERRSEQSSARTSRPRQELTLLLLLSTLAGIVDVTGFLRLDHVFTAHITGNLVILADQIVNGGPPHVPQLLAIPVFAAAVVLAYFLSGRGQSAKGGRALLVMQSLLLFAVLAIALRAPRRDLLAHGGVLAAMVAVAAMAFQNTYLRVVAQTSATTTVMTGNVATSIIAALSLVRPGVLTPADAAQKLRRTLPLVIGFFVGCAVGAAGAARLGPWAWATPALLSLLALPLASRAHGRPGHTALGAGARASRSAAGGP